MDNILTRKMDDWTYEGQNNSLIIYCLRWQITRTTRRSWMAALANEGYFPLVSSEITGRFWLAAGELFPLNRMTCINLLGRDVNMRPRRTLAALFMPIRAPVRSTTAPPLIPPKDPEIFGMRVISAQTRRSSTDFLDRPRRTFILPMKRL